MQIKSRYRNRIFFIGLPAVVLLSAVLIRLFLVTTYRVRSDAMLPTYRSGKLLWINRIASLDRGDVLVIKYRRDGEADSRFYLARLIGLPGDTLFLSKGGVVANRQKLKLPTSLLPREPYKIIVPRNDRTYRLTPLSLLACRRAIEEECSSNISFRRGKLYRDGAETAFFHFCRNYYWILADNPASGPDSRHLGIVPEESIVGVVMNAN